MFYSVNYNIDRLFGTLNVTSWKEIEDIALEKIKIKIMTNYELRKNMLDLEQNIMNYNNSNCCLLKFHKIIVGKIMHSEGKENKIYSCISNLIEIYLQDELDFAPIVPSIDKFRLITRFLSMFSDILVIAGNSALDGILNYSMGTIDIFFHSCTNEQAQEVVDYINKTYNIHQSKNLLTFIFNNIKIQLSLVIYNTMLDVARSFSVDCECVLYDLKTMAYYTTKRGYYSLSYRVNTLNFDYLSSDYLEHICEFINMGFSITVPYFNGGNLTLPYDFRYINTLDFSSQNNEIMKFLKCFLFQEVKYFDICPFPDYNNKKISTNLTEFFTNITLYNGEKLNFQTNSTSLNNSKWEISDEVKKYNFPILFDDKLKHISVDELKEIIENPFDKNIYSGFISQPVQKFDKIDNFIFEFVKEFDCYVFGSIVLNAVSGYLLQYNSPVYIILKNNEFKNNHFELFYYKYHLRLLNISEDEINYIFKDMDEFQDLHELLSDYFYPSISDLDCVIKSLSSKLSLIFKGKNFSENGLEILELYPNCSQKYVDKVTNLVKLYHRMIKTNELYLKIELFTENIPKFIIVETNEKISDDIILSKHEKYDPNRETTNKNIEIIIDNILYGNNSENLLDFERLILSKDGIITDDFCLYCVKNKVHLTSELYNPSNRQFNHKGFKDSISDKIFYSNNSRFSIPGFKFNIDDIKNIKFNERVNYYGTRMQKIYRDQNKDNLSDMFKCLNYFKTNIFFQHEDKISEFFEFFKKFEMKNIVIQRYTDIENIKKSVNSYCEENDDIPDEILEFLSIFDKQNNSRKKLLKEFICAGLIDFFAEINFKVLITGFIKNINSCLIGRQSKLSFEKIFSKLSIDILNLLFEMNFLRFDKNRLSLLKYSPFTLLDQEISYNHKTSKSIMFVLKFQFLHKYDAFCENIMIKYCSEKFNINDIANEKNYRNYYLDYSDISRSNISPKFFGDLNVYPLSQYSSDGKLLYVIKELFKYFNVGYVQKMDYNLLDLFVEHQVLNEREIKNLTYIKSVISNTLSESFYVNFNTFMPRTLFSDEKIIDIINNLGLNEQIHKPSYYDWVRNNNGAFISNNVEIFISGINENRSQFTYNDSSSDSEESYQRRDRSIYQGSPPGSPIILRTPPGPRSPRPRSPTVRSHPRSRSRTPPSPKRSPPRTRRSSPRNHLVYTPELRYNSDSDF